MARQNIELGTAPLGAGGDTPRSANIKINSMTTEIYARLAQLGTASNATLTTSSTDSAAGRVLKVGDFGVGGSTPIIGFNIDNQVLTLGLEGYAGGLSSGSKPTSTGIVKTIGFASDAVNQEWYEVTGAVGIRRRFFRSGYGTTNSWGPWSEYYHTGNTTRAADGTLKAI